MSYLVIARKFRPATFDEVIGQEHIVLTLKNAIAGGRVGHAFLFSGPRGVGKTTTARILAKALNCDKGPTPAPCGECPACQQISAGNYLDVVEIDGASNNSVDDIRELREKVRYAPAAGRYKIYIIDEVHMLSNSAFNALLKTLEEPPPHVKFVFATTEPHKVPATILSRCQRYDFRRVALADINSNLTRVSEAEGIKIGPDSLHKIARAAEGSLRDAQSILDQIVSSSGQQIEDADIDRVLGLVDQAMVGSVADAVLCRNGALVLELLDQLLMGGCNPVYFAQQLLGHIRNLLLLKMCQKPGSLLEVTDEELRVLGQQAEKTSVPELIQVIKIMLEDEEQLRRALNSRVVLEVLLLKLTEIRPLLPVEEILTRLSQLEGSSAKESPNTISSKDNAKQSSAQNSLPVVSKRCGSQPVDLQSMVQSPQETAEPNHNSVQVWQAITAGVRKRKPALGHILDYGKIVSFNEQEMQVGFEGVFFKEKADEPENRSIIEEIINEQLGLRAKLKISQQVLTQGEINHLIQNEAQKPGRVQKTDDPLVNKAMSLFAGQIVEIKPMGQQSEMTLVADDQPETDA
jgi:DNA polymerase-3 subunit gamma/tau